MKRTFTEYLLMARQNARLTQERAAEKIGISRRSLAYYEQGRRPTDEVVARMVQVYDAQYLGYAYLAQETATGRAITSQFEQADGVASGVMQINVQIKKLDQMNDRVEEICMDNVVSNDELPEYKRYIDRLDKLYKYIAALKYAVKKGAATR